jgi:hypothetical protein
MTTTKSKKTMTKMELAILAAGAMNLLNDLPGRADPIADGGWDMRHENAFHKLASLLPEDVRAEFYNNSTLDPRDLGVKS